MLSENDSFVSSSGDGDDGGGGGGGGGSGGGDGDIVKSCVWVYTRACNCKRKGI